MWYYTFIYKDLQLTSLGPSMTQWAQSLAGAVIQNHDLPRHGTPPWSTIGFSFSYTQLVLQNTLYTCPIHVLYRSLAQPLSHFRLSRSPIALRPYVFFLSINLNCVKLCHQQSFKASTFQLPILPLALLQSRQMPLVTILSDGRQSVFQSPTYLLILEWRAASTPLKWVLWTRATFTRGKTRLILLDDDERTI